MVLQLITSSVVSVVAGSWIAASIFIKYLLVGLAAKNAYNGTLNIESLLKDVREGAEEVVVGLILAGAVISFSGLSPVPFIQLLSEVAALSYFAYLFWKY